LIPFALFSWGSLSFSLLFIFFNWLWRKLSPDFDLEDISSRSSVLVQIISGNDHEIDWYSNTQILKNTRSKSERFASSSVQEILERNPGCGEILTSNAELHHTFFWTKLLKTWRNDRKFSFTHIGSSCLEGKFARGINWFTSLGEKNLNTVVLETFSGNLQNLCIGVPVDFMIIARNDLNENRTSGRDVF
jgi:hypothetical protein